jgi:hypothetical protein
MEMVCNRRKGYPSAREPMSNLVTDLVEALASAFDSCHFMKLSRSVNLCFSSAASCSAHYTTLRKLCIVRSASAQHGPRRGSLQASFFWGPQLWRAWCFRRAMFEPIF